MEIGEWTKDKANIQFLEDMETDSGTTPPALERIRTQPDLNEGNQWILDAIRFLFESRTSLKPIGIDTLLNYAKVYPVYDMQRFVEIIRRVDKAIISYYEDS